MVDCALRSKDKIFNLRKIDNIVRIGGLTQNLQAWCKIDNNSSDKQKSFKIRNSFEDDAKKSLI